MKRPVFVYGTLRNGLHNYKRVLEGLTKQERSGTMTGRLYAADHERFPCLVKEGNTVIQGEVMYIKEDRYEKVLRALDRLEGYEEGNPADSDYIRETVTVIDETGSEVEAYTYFWNQPIGLGEHITSGDWLTWLQQKRKTAGP
ncbi:gamma-glutamylcyclotransferase family protein [Salibacterium aidingense]|uniref:gamma-glutamylcyclotransferase family protein n=1 Tax=Salibacterium aidingense TaxID=384933 RepID=UPI000686D8C7|nr:gamma-glutamylcyclotransferase family protein [Salibacterium aidingense]